jgi:hypothetical protein
LRLIWHERVGRGIRLARLVGVVIVVIIVGICVVRVFFDVHCTHTTGSTTRVSIWRSKHGTVRDAAGQIIQNLITYEAGAVAVVVDGQWGYGRKGSRWRRTNRRRGRVIVGLVLLCVCAISAFLFVVTAYEVDGSLKVGEVVSQWGCRDVSEDEVLDVVEGRMEIGRGGLDDGSKEEGKRIVRAKGVITRT